MATHLDKSILFCYGLMVVLTTLANYHLVPVFPHMLFITLATIYIGCRMSVRSIHASSGTKNVDGNIVIDNGIIGVVCDDSSPVAETMQRKDAMMFPILGSVVLFSLYLVFKFLPKHLINFVLKSYFFILGALILANLLSTLLQNLLPTSIAQPLANKNVSIPNPEYYFNIAYDKIMSIFSKSSSPSTSSSSSSSASTPASSSSSSSSSSSGEGLSSVSKLTMLDMCAAGLSVVCAVLYILSGHFALSNLFGIAFSIQGIQSLSLGSFMNGAILLSGLFVYDVFWVFGTDVMVTVAKSFDAPIKLLFPQFHNPLSSDSAVTPSSMLGLGDIVIPGIFIALMLRFDIANAIRRNKNKPPVERKDVNPLTSIREFVQNTPYFSSVFIFYAIGLTTTVFVMYAFKAAQPALLYLVPACLGSVTAVAFYRGEFTQLQSYTEGEEEGDKKKAATAESETKKAQ